MKYVVILLVVGVLIWWAARPRQVKGPPSARRPGADSTTPALMVRCEHCGLHLPRDEALPGPAEGFYCNEAHRRLGPVRR